MGKNGKTVLLFMNFYSMTAPKSCPSSGKGRVNTDAFYISWLAANLDLLIEICKYFSTNLVKILDFDQICILGKCGSPGSGANVTFVLLGRILICEFFL